MRDSRARLRRLEERAAKLRPLRAALAVLLIDVRSDGVGRFEWEGQFFAVTSKAELDAFLTEHRWRPLRVIFGCDSGRDGMSGEDTRWR